MAPSDGSERGGPPPEYRPTREYDAPDNAMRNLAIAAVGIAVVVMGGVYALSRHHGGGVPVIEADAGPVRIKPTDPGGMQVAGADDSVPMKADGTEDDSLMAPPETPAPLALAQQTRQADAAAAQAPPVPTPATAAAPPVAEAPPPEQPLPVPQASQPAPPRPIVRAPKPVVREPAPVPASGHGGTQVQLAALDSEAAAHAAWDRLKGRLPDLFAGHTPTVIAVTKGDKMFYRLRTGGFADIAAATAFCTRLRAQGAGCTIASF